MASFAEHKAVLVRAKCTGVECFNTPFKVYSGAGTQIPGSDRTMTGDEAVSDIYIRSGTGNFTDTLPSASSVISACADMKGEDAQVGDSWELIVQRTGGPTVGDTMTFNAGTGVTILGRNRFRGFKASQCMWLITQITPTPSVSFYTLHNNL